MFVSNNYEIIETIKENNKYYYIISNKYGKCKVLKSELKRGKIPGIRSALDKTEYFQNQSNEIHNNKYLVLSEYVKDKDKVILFCSLHGEFFQTPANHLEGQGCPTCGNIVRVIKNTFTMEEIIIKSKIIHNSKYEYLSLTGDFLTIQCPIHGNFIQNKITHLQGHGCPKCGYENSSKLQKLTQEEFELKANLKHNFKYDYSKFIYDTKVIKSFIICLLHGEFLQKPSNHLQGQGCPKCSLAFRGNHNDYKNWKLMAEKSNYFDSFKVYIIHCFNENEEFIKIGKTYRKISERFSSKKEMPYSYKIIKEFVFNSSKDCCDFEQQLHKQFNPFQIIPLIDFGGKFECYSLDILSEFSYN